MGFVVEGSAGAAAAFVAGVQGVAPASLSADRAWTTILEVSLLLGVVVGLMTAEGCESGNAQRREKQWLHTSCC